MTNHMNNDTICAPTTATGGAIAMIRISGPQSMEVLSAIFSKDLSEAQPNTVHYGFILSHKKETIDEVMASIFRAPHSYTGEDCVELSCHGSRYIINKVLELLVENGCRMAAPGEFTQRAFLNGKMDLSQAEAVADLIASESASAHRMAMNQLRGEFSSELANLRQQLLNLTSLLELELDFTDQDVEFADRSNLKDLCMLIEQRISRLTQSFRTGNALKNGVPVAIIGAPNVGKSTLLNALLHDDKAIVSEIYGTTRDLIEDTIQIQGITFRFIDTAGIRHTNDKIEKMGIERSQQAASRAQIIIMMSEPDVPEPEIAIRPEQKVIHILNKSDRFQAINGLGLAQLEKELAESVGVPQEGEVIVSNQRHYEALTLALEDIRRVQSGLATYLPTDLIAIDLRQCLHHLAEITGGEITTDEVLGTIFSKFCVGK